MDNVTCDAQNLTPNNCYKDTETYSRLSTVSTSHQIQLQDKDDHVTQSVLNVMNNSNLKTPAYRRKMLLFAATTMLLLVTSLVSIALSVAAYAQASFNDHSETNKELSSVQTQLAATQMNMSKFLTLFEGINQDLLSVNTQLMLTPNMSHILTQFDARISSFISTLYENLRTQIYCGPGQWQRVAYLNMTDPTEQCPSSWELYNTSAVRACGRPQFDKQICPATAYSINNYQYSRVCGRVIGYQVGTPDGFSSVRNTFKLDGIVISHGTQQDHIWSYVSGWTESEASSACPCISQGHEPPPSIGENYYCESGNKNTTYMVDHVYASDKLWDGQQCEGTCCTGTNPPWFSVRLPVPTNDIIKVHICCDQPTSDEDIQVELLELYVQ